MCRAHPQHPGSCSCRPTQRHHKRRPEQDQPTSHIQAIECGRLEHTRNHHHQTDQCAPHENTRTAIRAITATIKYAANNLRTVSVIAVPLYRDALNRDGGGHAIPPAPPPRRMWGARFARRQEGKTFCVPGGLASRHRYRRATTGTSADRRGHRNPRSATALWEQQESNLPASGLQPPRPPWNVYSQLPLRTGCKTHSSYVSIRAANSPGHTGASHIVQSVVIGPIQVPSPLVLYLSQVRLGLFQSRSVCNFLNVPLIR